MRSLEIRIPPVRGQVSYFVALHEIGHLVGGGRSGRRLEKEEAAWRYALAHALVAPTDATRRRIGRRLRSYVTWAQARSTRRVAPFVPPATTRFGSCWPGSKRDVARSVREDFTKSSPERVNSLKRMPYKEDIHLRVENEYVIATHVYPR